MALLLRNVVNEPEKIASNSLGMYLLNQNGGFCFGEIVVNPTNRNESETSSGLPRAVAWSRCKDWGRFEVR